MEVPRKASDVGLAISGAEPSASATKELMSSTKNEPA